MAWCTRRTMGGAADSPGSGYAASAKAERAGRASWALRAALIAEPIQTQMMNHLNRTSTQLRLANGADSDPDSDLAPAFAAAWSPAPPERRSRIDRALIPHSTARNPAMQYTGHGRYFSGSSSVCCPRPRDKEKWACHHDPRLDGFLQELKRLLAPSPFNLPGLVMSVILLPWCTSDGKIRRQPVLGTPRSRRHAEL